MEEMLNQADAEGYFFFFLIFLVLSVEFDSHMLCPIWVWPRRGGRNQIH